MPYCVKCGVELDTKLKACPLCKTPVYMPDETDENANKPYPERIQKEHPRYVNLVPSKAFVYLMTFILIIPLIVCLMIDLRKNGTITWSFYPVTSIILVWILMAYPALMKRYSFLKVLTIDIYSLVLFLISLDAYSGNFLSWSVYPVASLLLVWVYFLLGFLFGKRHPFFLAFIAYISTGLYLYLIEQATGSLWFFDLALPLLTLLLALTLLTFILSRFKFFGGIALVGLIFCAISAFCFGAEFIINRFVFGNGLSLFWSLIVAGVLLPIAAFLFFVQRNEELRLYLEKKFHI
ncbi:hypothetical protein Cst_c03030 [Thermoclostridium stercorarium subsp. stercorarium DSM 8532]|jgi:hypothetical protein|uniref:Zinc ribbon domain-containing protein n=3 Tax=Thermoclostridium stercorarium TaxID=1510 RepID=L7VKP9_THES1|nr:DUF6320 domain-containing protein [Thermoclostridium stercorarium]AGC67327.1 hypothetical protein Cst_c03030 [Thermoclostridium stercorarium subsp. stercorarium DSM 8532]AGI38389.1 hypothetical protein Clst_0286 [Thermoclostridium stercorarium subsp. stercorarium DSM 8532]ANW97825.1 hypothetical protein CSTERTH_01625 [Thermoclostridium stercorarium subsp. thermolacticum DSM 2910]ANX00351.1 hypothetical protein CSTERLE_01455 [Thermoclostridium stercorarium subsp. leptospartum DSM 9219]UZQ858